MENLGIKRSISDKTSVSRRDGEELAAAALAYLAEEPGRLARFLDLSGLEPHTLRAAAAGRGFLAAVLDYLLSEEKLVVAFAAERGLDPQRIALARRAMEGPP